MKEAFLEYFRELVGDAEAEQFFCAIEGKDLRRGLRINTLKSEVTWMKDWLVENGYEVKKSEFSGYGLEIKGRGVRWSLKLPYHAGFTYPQDLASMFAVEMLDPQPGETVLDMTAAPGGKTTHIAQKMRNTGVVIANDMDSRRLKALHSNLERLGIWNTIVTRMLAHNMAGIYGEIFDRVLLDPSCSGEGLLVTRDGKPSYWNKKALKKYSAEQFGLLCSAFSLLKPGGRLVYSTCTLNDVEDDGVVERLLAKFPEAEILEVDVKGVPEQIGDLKGVRFWPHKTGTRGFFCIAIGKKSVLDLDKVESGMAMHEQHLKCLSDEQLNRYSNYLENEFACDLPDGEFTLKDDVLFVVSSDIKDFSLLTKYSLAFPLLKIGRDKIRPTHAGALWLGLHAKKGVYDLNRDEVEKVFERQPVKNTSGETGLRLAKYEGFPLGVAKLTEKRVEVLVPRQY
jgi:NOL1/NOP2/sun family putative RNA methylase